MTDDAKIEMKDLVTGEKYTFEAEYMGMSFSQDGGRRDVIKNITRITRPFRIGDFVTCEGRQGVFRVQDVGDERLQLMVFDGSSTWATRKHVRIVNPTEAEKKEFAEVEQKKIDKQKNERISALKQMARDLTGNYDMTVKDVIGAVIDMNK